MHSALAMLTPLTSQVGRFCTGDDLELCAASLNADSSTSPPDKVDGNPPGDVSSASSSGSSASNASVGLAINATALNALVLEPAGGVSAAGGHLLVDNVSPWLGSAGRGFPAVMQSFLV